MFVDGEELTCPRRQTTWSWSREPNDGGLVEINHAPDQLGMTQHEIDALHAARQHLDSFTSADDLSAYAKLPASRVDELRDFIICL